MTHQYFKLCNCRNTDSNQKKRVVGNCNWLLEVVCSFPEISTQSLRSWHRLQTEFSLKEAVDSVTNSSLQPICLQRHLWSNWIKIWSVEYHEESKCALGICIKNAELKATYFTNEN